MKCEVTAEIIAPARNDATCEVLKHYYIGTEGMHLRQVRALEKYSDTHELVEVRDSYDNGKTWSEEKKIGLDSPDWDHGYPSTVELSNGDLLTVYYQKETQDGPCVIMQSIWQLPEAYR